MLTNHTTEAGRVCKMIEYLCNMNKRHQRQREGARWTKSAPTQRRERERESPPPRATLSSKNTLHPCQGLFLYTSVKGKYFTPQLSTAHGLRGDNQLSTFAGRLGDYILSYISDIFGRGLPSNLSDTHPWG